MAFLCLIASVILCFFEAIGFNPMDEVSEGWLGLTFLVLHFLVPGIQERTTGRTDS